MKKLLIVTAILIVASCSNNNRLDEFKVFDGNEQATNLSMDDVIEKTSTILLDTSSAAPLLGEIFFVHESEDAYYIISGDTAVFEYGKTGDFVRKIGAEGRGPGEYLSAEVSISMTNYQFLTFQAKS